MNKGIKMDAYRKPEPNPFNDPNIDRGKTIGMELKEPIKLEDSINNYHPNSEDNIQDDLDDIIIDVILPDENYQPAEEIEIPVDYIMSNDAIGINLTKDSRDYRILSSDSDHNELEMQEKSSHSREGLLEDYILRGRIKQCNECNSLYPNDMITPQNLVEEVTQWFIADELNVNKGICHECRDKDAIWKIKRGLNL